MTYKIDSKDLGMIVSYSKDKFFYLNPPLWVSQKEVERGELPSLAMIEAVLMFLNSKKLLVKQVNIDYTQILVDDSDIPELEEKKPVI